MCHLPGERPASVLHVQERKISPPPLSLRCAMAGRTSRLTSAGGGRASPRECATRHAQPLLRSLGEGGQPSRAWSESERPPPKPRSKLGVWSGGGHEHDPGREVRPVLFDPSIEFLAAHPRHM